MIRNYKKISFVVLMTLSLSGCEDFKKFITPTIHEPPFEARNSVVFKNLEESYNKKDFEQAFYYASLIAEQKEFSDYKLNDNLIESIYLKLGYMKLKGAGTQQNVPEAIVYFNKATEYNNSPGAHFSLGKMYIDAKEVSLDVSKGLKHLNASADNGNVYAMSELANIYKEGKIVPKDMVKSIGFANKAAKLKDIKGMLFLVETYLLEDGYIDYQSAKTISEDITKIPKTEYNQQDLGTNLIYLGGIYEYGLGTKKDIKKALEYYQDASFLKNPQALYILGKVYEEGKHRKKDLNNAKELYQMGAELGSPEAKKAYERLNKSVAK